MLNVQQFALNLIVKNPNIIQNEKQKHWVDVIRNGNSQEGEQLANNLLNTYGVKKEDIPNIAQQFFSKMFK